MIYNQLGNSGLKVSQLGFGNWATSGTNAQETANLMIKTAWEAGINFFDTAEVYDNGCGEHQFGIGLKNLGVSRDQLVVSTKLFWGSPATSKVVFNPECKITVNQNGTNRKHLIQGMKQSLKNLQMDYVDIVFCHRFDIHTTTEEVCHAMKVIMNKGMALYWGTSMWPAQRLIEAMYICDRIGCPRPISEQPEYNLLHRAHVEKYNAVLYDDYGLGNATWSPVAQGLLSGKYNDGEQVEGRLTSDPNIQGMYWTPYFSTPELKDKTCGKLKAMKEYCETK